MFERKDKLIVKAQSILEQKRGRKYHVTVGFYV